MSDKVKAIKLAAETFGTRLEQPLSLLDSTFAQASKIESTAPENRTSDQSTAIISRLGLVEDLQEALEDGDVLFQHISAIIEATAALAWVVSEDPVEHMKAAISDVGEPLTALRKKTDPSHGEFADAIDAFMHTMSDHVSRNHPAALTFVDASGGVDEDALIEEARSGEASHEAQHLSDFRNAVTDATAKQFQKASDAVSPEVAKMAKYFVTASNLLYDFLVLASTVSKMPSDDELKLQLKPISDTMVTAYKYTESFPPSHPHFAHVKGINEAMRMFSWVASKDGPIAYVLDSEASAAFYTTKILVATKRTTDSSAHKQFVDSLNAVFSAMRSYVERHFSAGMRFGMGVGSSADAERDMHSSLLIADDEEDVDADTYVSSFKSLISGPVEAYFAACEAIGGPVLDQATAFKEAWIAEARFLSIAFKTPKPAEIEPLVEPIADLMRKVTEISESADPRGPLTQHLMAVSEAIPALGWIAVEEKATVFVSDMSSAGQFFIDKVKMSARKTDDPSAHRGWALCLERVWLELKAYVKEHHTQALVWNPPKRNKPALHTRQFVEEDSVDSSNYVSAFKELITGPLDAYVKASTSIGGDVAIQSRAFANAWKAEAKFLEKAINMDKPDDVNAMLVDISQNMGEVRNITENTDPRGPLTQHLNAVSESMAALGWVAVDEKATAFVADMAGTGQFYIDKVKMSARKLNNPEQHKDWAKKLETLWSDLKAYVKEHHTQKLVWNPPKKIQPTTQARDVSAHDADGPSDYVSAFNDLMSGPLKTFVEYSTTIGCDVEKQANLFAEAWRAEADFLAKAINMPKPDDIQGMVTQIAEKMGEVATLAESADPRGSMTHHLKAVSESVAALGWVAVDEKATAFVGDMSGAGQFYIDKVKMNARHTKDPQVHREWAKSLETLWVELKAYVKEHHTQKLVWNPPKDKQISRGSPTLNVVESDANDYVSAFKNIIADPLTSFVNASASIGGDVSLQAKLFFEAWEEEEKFLEKAIRMPKPSDVQSMLTDIGTKMAGVGAITESADPRGPLVQHLNAVSESMPALGWVAVDEKATAFVGDMSSAGQFYIDKVKMNAKRTEDPALHREWAKCLESLWSELKAYVKQYHTQSLVWNPPRRPTVSSRAQSSYSVQDEGRESVNYVSAFRQLISNPVATYVKASEAIGGVVETQAKLFFEAWELEAEFLGTAINIQKPDDVQGMLGGLAGKMGEIRNMMHNASPSEPLTNHLSAVGESVEALGWVVVDEKATGFVGDMASAGQFYLDRVKMSARTTDNPKLHRDWAQSLERVWAELKAYVKQYHTQSLSWKR